MNPQNRVSLAYRPGKKQMDYKQLLPLDDRICMQDQTYILRAVYNKRKAVPPDYQISTLDSYIMLTSDTKEPLSEC